MKALLPPGGVGASMPTPEELLAEKDTVIARIKAYVQVGMQDKRMAVASRIVLDAIARIEREEAQRTAEGARRGKPL